MLLHQISAIMLHATNNNQIDCCMRRKSLQSDKTRYSRVDSRSISKTIPTTSSYLSQLEQYQSIMTREPLIKFRTKKPSPISKKQTNNNTFQLNEELRKAKQQLAEIRKEIRIQRHHTEKSFGDKIERVLSSFKDTLHQKQIRDYSPASPQIYYPVPLPMPYPYMVQNHAASSKQSPASFRTKDTIQVIKDKFKDKEFKANRRRRNMGKWRKVTNSILFILYLKGFCQRFQKARKLMFSKFISKYKDISSAVTTTFKQNLRPFFKLLQMKKDVKFQIEQDDRKEIIKEKKQLIRNMIKMILKAILEGVQSSKGDIAQYCYFLCHHGSYACTYPLLTEQELELSCISSIFHYLSAGKHLEKAAIINTIFIRAVIANLFLSQPHLSPNIYYLSSVLYEFVIDIQDEYLLKVPKSYQIGNYQSYSFVKQMDSIVVNDSEHQSGQIISGLLGEQYIKRHVRLDEWGQQKKMVGQILSKIWLQMKGLHNKLIVKFY